MTDLPTAFENYTPPEVPRMSDDEAKEVAAHLLTSLVQSVFQHVDAEAVIDNSEQAYRLNMLEQELVAKLIDTAHVDLNVSWDE